MAEYGGPSDSEDDKPGIYGDYLIEPRSIENSGNDSFLLPHWTDPPTGEIPAVLSELNGEDTSIKSRISALRFSSLFSSATEESTTPFLDHFGEAKDGDKDLSATRRLRPQLREDRTYRRQAIKPPETEALKISSRYDSSRRNRANSVKFHKGDPDEVFKSPEEIELPNKRFNITLPKLLGDLRRKSMASRDDDRAAEPQDRQTGTIGHSTADEHSVTEDYVPSSFSSRRERISKTREASPSARPGRRGPIFVRVTTGVALGAVVLLAFHFGSVTTLGVVAVAVFMAIIEFYDTLRRAGFKPASLLGIAGTLSLLITTYQKGANGIALVFASMVIASMLWYLVGVIRGQPTINISVTFLGFIWIGGLGSFAAAMLRPQDFPHSHGVAYLMGALIATVANDTGAYFMGSWFGKHKMVPEISPTKSWEGLIAGAIASVFISAVVVSQISPWTVSKAVVLGIVVAVVAPLGDLSESMIKRDLHIKDMGKLLPGHGGMLDRIDGLLFVLPAVYYLLKILNLS